MDEQDSKPRPDGILGDLAELLGPRGMHSGRPTPIQAIERVITRPGPLALLLHRIAHRLWLAGLSVPAELLWRASFFLTGADIHPAARIGAGLRITHTSGIVIGKGVRIGRGVTVLPGVTLGGGELTMPDGRVMYGFPTIDAGTQLSVGAKVIGPVRVGKDCMIGANAVIARDLTDGVTVTIGRDLADLDVRIRDLDARVSRLERESRSATASQ